MAKAFPNYAHLVCHLLVVFYLSNHSLQIYNKNLATPTPLGNGGVRIYFFIEKKGGRGREKSGLNTTMPTPYSNTIPHTILCATKNKHKYYATKKTLWLFVTFAILHSDKKQLRFSALNARKSASLSIYNRIASPKTSH